VYITLGDSKSPKQTSLYVRSRTKDSESKLRNAFYSIHHSFVTCKQIKHGNDVNTQNIVVCCELSLDGYCFTCQESSPLSCFKQNRSMILKKQYTLFKNLLEGAKYSQHMTQQCTIHNPVSIMIVHDLCQNVCVCG